MRLRHASSSTSWATSSDWAGSRSTLRISPYTGPARRSYTASNAAWSPRATRPSSSVQVLVRPLQRTSPRADRLHVTSVHARYSAPVPERIGGGCAGLTSGVGQSVVPVAANTVRDQSKAERCHYPACAGTRTAGRGVGAARRGRRAGRCPARGGADRPARRPGGGRGPGRHQPDPGPGQGLRDRPRGQPRQAGSGRRNPDRAGRVRGGRWHARAAPGSATAWPAWPCSVCSARRPRSPGRTPGCRTSCRRWRAWPWPRWR